MDTTSDDVLKLMRDVRHLLKPTRGVFCSAECLGQCEDCRLIARVDAALASRPAPPQGDATLAKVLHDAAVAMITTGYLQDPQEDYGYRQGVRKVAQMLLTHPALSRAAGETWVPVGERLPEDGQENGAAGAK